MQQNRMATVGEWVHLSVRLFVPGVCVCDDMHIIQAQLPG